MMWLAWYCLPCAKRSSAWTTEQRRPGRQVQAQRCGPGFETQVGSLQGLAIEVEVQALGTLDLDPGQPGTDEQAITGQQVTQRAQHFLWGRQHGDIEQAIIDYRIRAQLLPASRLAAIADTQCQQIPLPVEIRPCSSTEAARSSLKREAGEQIAAARTFFRSSDVLAVT